MIPAERLPGARLAQFPLCHPELVEGSASRLLLDIQTRHESHKILKRRRLVTRQALIRSDMIRGTEVLSCSHFSNELD
jgi:hypothetical protein